MTASEIESLIRSTAADYGVDPNLAVALARRESGLNPYAVGSSGEIGVFQLSAAAAQDVGVNRNVLEGNIAGGVLYLRRMLNQFSDPYLALAAYNAGPGNVSRGVIPASTQAYAAGILAAAGQSLQPVPVFSATNWGTGFEAFSPSTSSLPPVRSVWPWLLALGAVTIALVSLRQ